VTLTEDPVVTKAKIGGIYGEIKNCSGFFCKADERKIAGILALQKNPSNF